VALSVGSPLLGVTQRPAWRSSDFPPAYAGGHPVCLAPSQSNPKPNKGQTGAAVCYNKTVETPPRLLLFDGNAIVHRAYHAIKTGLSVRRTGEVVNAVFGFAQMLLKAVSEVQPTHLALTFDLPGPTFRHDLDPEYKAHRPPMPEDLASQLDRVREVVAAMNIQVYELSGYEADDMLGTLSAQAQALGAETVIVTSDGDMMQLVQPGVRVLYIKMSGGTSDALLYDDAAVIARYQVTPDQVRDLKGLKGDTSDNIKGVRGVGDKTAVKLIQQFGSIEDIYQHLDEITPASLQEKLRAGVESARHSKVMATIVTDAPVTLDLDACRADRFDLAATRDIFAELEFFSLMDRLPGSADEASGAPVVADEPAREARAVTTEAELDALAARLKAAGAFAFDTETDGLDSLNCNLVGISVSDRAGEGDYIPVGHIDTVQLPLATVAAKLGPVFADENIKKYAHNAKFDVEVLAGHGITVGGLGGDTMIAAHLLGDSEVDLKTLGRTRLNVAMTEIKELIGRGAKQISMAAVPLADACAYAAADAEVTYRLADILFEQLKSEGLWELFMDVEMPLVSVLVRMEQHGIQLDATALEDLPAELGEQIGKLQADIYDYAEHEFNINSPQQIGKVLFEELELPPTRRSHGSYSTEASELETLRDRHEIIGAILEYRQLAKLKSTYVDALPPLVNPKTGRLHTRFNQTRAATGRLASADPNLQNIPIRTELGRRVRRAFTAPPGTLLLAGDYSQIDLRALAHLSGDPSLVKAFAEDADIHAATAARLYGIPQSEVSADQRRFAKTVNFGVIYGMSGFGLMQATELSREEATQFIKSYFEQYPGVTEYLEAVKQQARDTGYVETLLGRRRYIPEVRSSNRQVREAAERMAINMPVQGTSADIIKVAMINLDRAMREQEFKSKMLLQVHDELVFEVPEAELEAMCRLVTDSMVSAVALSVPLKVDLKSGPNWEDMRRLD
jgi:DNA polymerase I